MSINARPRSRSRAAVNPKGTRASVGAVRRWYRRAITVRDEVVAWREFAKAIRDIALAGAALVAVAHVAMASC